MSTSEAYFSLRVECYGGYRGEELPRCIYLHSRAIEVVEILDRWLAPDHRYFKVRGDDRAIYIIRHEEATGKWELTMFDRSEGKAMGGE
ncbi:MAG: hypothetical protein ABFR63_04920 [Thermodesulfobacteriota bacterium]